jgi:hypothetical protein
MATRWRRDDLSRQRVRGTLGDGRLSVVTDHSIRSRRCAPRRLRFCEGAIGRMLVRALNRDELVALGRVTASVFDPRPALRAGSWMAGEVTDGPVGSFRCWVTRALDRRQRPRCRRAHFNPRPALGAPDWRVWRGWKRSDLTRGEPAALGRVDASAPSGSATVSMGRGGAGFGRRGGNHWSRSANSRHRQESGSLPQAESVQGVTAGGRDYVLSD